MPDFKKVELANMFSNLSLTPEQAKFRAQAIELAQKHLCVRAAALDQEAAWPVENIKAIGEAGLMGLGIAKEWGGPGDDVLSIILVLEEFAKGCTTTAMSCLMHYSVLPAISLMVNDEQRKMFLDPVIKGTSLGSASMSEPGTGSRLWHLNSYATAGEGEYIINSFKSFCTSNNFNNFYFVPVRVNETAQSNDLIVFIVPSTNPNIEVIGKWDGMGLRGSSSNPVFFNNCRVPVSHKLGGDENAFPLLLSSVMPLYMLGLSAIYLGVAQSAFQAAVEHVKKKKYTDNNERGSDIESIQRYIGEMRMEISLVRESIYRQAKMLDAFKLYVAEVYHAGLLKEISENVQGDDFFIDLAQVKVAACEMAINVTNKALQVCGGAGYIRGHIVERCYRDARAGSVMGPSDDIVKVMIGRKIMGLKYPWE
jgi:alkylation response protein AidB-like acyl-CoA dehydrogenase